MAYPEEVKDRARALRRSGLSVREIERELAGPGRMTVWRWTAGAHDGPGARVKAARGRRAVDLPEVVGDGPIYPDIDPEDKDAIIDRLMLENAVLRGTHEVLKGRALSSLTNREKSQLIEWLRAGTGRSLRELTGFLRISKSSYEYWRRRLRDPGPTLREEIADDVERIFREDGDCARGYRFVHARLAAERGPVTEKAVRDVMRERRLEVVYKKKKPGRYSSYAGELDEAPANLPLRADGTHDFRADAPNERWVTDITEFKLPDDARKVYLSPVVDLFDGKPVAWSIGLRPDAALANSSLEAACATLRPGEHPVCHSDRGCHYRWPGWKAICERHGVVRSMSRKGCSPDNAACEGFFGRLKNEFFHGRDWSGVSAEEFIGRLEGWMRFYSEGRLKLFVEADGGKVYDTIDNRRRRLGYAA
ncbi:MAG: IS3 family transposase [Coriobacteriia bacterium]|nr:IS3 family transposase [Coriobacteriia bacterium]